ncbi:hypothetical protein COCON_G00077540 [Conger conger]|uniref:Solute carrier family 12 member 9 n=1 Tax=Conger conger TaxID=82655 RepID=A0A9Q1DNY5_CONCO|nr:hypothetical protein COCON_G00077540 [Conger conger]
MKAEHCRDLQEENQSMQKDMVTLKGILQETENMHTQSKLHICNLMASCDDKDHQICTLSRELQILSASVGTDKTCEPAGESLETVWKLETEITNLQAMAEQQTSVIAALQNEVAETARAKKDLEDINQQTSLAKKVRLKHLDGSFNRLDESTVANWLSGSTCRAGTAMANERTALLDHGVYSVQSESEISGSGQQGNGFVHTSGHSATPRSLNTFFGVIVPTVLSMFSIVLFLRTGFVVGHAGLLQGLLMLAVAYFIISLTILSICAISTNGAVEGGGAYYMISRSLGPEFGGSIGLMFYLAKVCACGVYILGLVEAILNIFGRDPGSAVSEGIRVLPQGYWYTVLYAAVALQLCLLVCLVGAHVYSRASFLILLVVTVALLSVLISPLVVWPREFSISHQCPTNGTCVYNATYTGFNSTTLRRNLGPGYSLDYSTNTVMSFATVFAVMFTSCTGIMAGANMSGELKNPSVAIPKGTIIAVLYTFCVYVILFILVSSTCDRALLTLDYGFLQRINVWPPFVIIGVYCASLSAAMCSLIGASRILHALALDQVFGLPLAPAAITSKSGNPWVAVLYTWALVQCVVFAGQLNFIAGLVTVFYLLAYAAVDLACLSLEWASAPNFRPTFQFFSWHTCLLGIISCLVMMFVINPVYSSASIVVLLVLLLILHYRSPTSSWGYISQALIFHQVRKYLLMLDVRKEHVKFWRPQVLLMVANPRSSCQLITFINQLKRAGSLCWDTCSWEFWTPCPRIPSSPSIPSG